MIDTHSHLDSEQFAEDYQNVIRESFDSGMQAIILPAVEIAGFNRIVQIAESDDRLFFAAGIHPHSAAELTSECEKEIIRLTQHPKCKAIGEIGLDYYYDFQPKDLQREAFRKQIKIAQKCNLPMIIHNREADADVISILKEELNIRPINAVLHCFSSPMEVAMDAIEMGMHISFTGNITFKKSELSPIVEALPLNRIMLETDAPYMTPVPNRGKRNHPKYLKLIAEKIAEIKQINIEEVIEMTTNNAKRFFKLFLPALLILCGSFNLFAQSSEEEYEATESPNFKRSLFGIGVYGASNTVVETYKVKGGDKEISYDGLFTPGVSIYSSPLDFLMLSFSYSHSKNKKISEDSRDQFGNLTYGATTYGILDFNTHWIANPGKRINFYGTLGIHTMFNTTNVGALGGKPEISTTDWGVNAGIGVAGNIKFDNVGLLNIVAGWDLLFPFNNFDGYLMEGTPREAKLYEVSKYFSILKFGIVFYPNIF